MAVDPLQGASAADDMLCLALHAASRAMTGRYRTLLNPFGVTYPQYLVLLVLKQDGPSSLVSIGDQLRLESSTLSPLVRRLEAQGVVTRTRSTTDERAVTIELTSHGVSLCDQLAVVPKQASDATGMDRPAQARLAAELHQLEVRLRE